jgi:hypothetical protein
LDQVAILGQFADEWIDLPQTERSLRAALQIAAYEAVLGNAQLQRRRTGIIASRAAILLDQLEDALDATDSEFTLASMYGIADSADVASRLVWSSHAPSSFKVKDHCRIKTASFM